jgi:hypothetical protein
MMIRGKCWPNCSMKWDGCLLVLGNFISNFDGEPIGKDLSELSESERKSILINDSPELLGLLGDLKEKLAEVQLFLKPLLERYVTCDSLSSLEEL